MAQVVDISLYSGSAYTLRFVMTPATNVTGWTTVWTLKQHPSDSSALMQKTPSTSDALNGVWSVNLQRSDTLILVPGTYYYDLKRIDASNETELTTGQLVSLRSVNP